MVQLFTESQNGWIWMASPQVGSATAGCSGSCPMMETLEPAGTTCLRLTAKNVFLSLNSIPSISVGAHCLFSWHYWKQLQPLFLHDTSTAGTHMYNIPLSLPFSRLNNPGSPPSSSVPSSSLQSLAGFSLQLSILSTVESPGPAAALQMSQQDWILARDHLPRPNNSTLPSAALRGCWPSLLQGCIAGLWLIWCPLEPPRPFLESFFPGGYLSLCCSSMIPPVFQSLP